MVTYDGINAYLCCCPGSNPRKDFSIHTLKYAIKKIGISTRVNFQALQEFSHRISQGVFTQPVLISTGEYPEPSEKGSWVMAPRASSSDAEKRVIPNFFTKGQTICLFQSKGKGRPGWDVWGKPVDPFPGEKPRLAEGIKDVSGRLVAEKNGYLFSANMRWELLNDLTISGKKLAFYVPLQVPASISIQDELPKHIHVEAQGNIFVAHSAHRSELISKQGSVRVEGEVAHSMISAKEGISCGTAFHSVLKAEGDIEIRTSLSGGSKASTDGGFFTREGSVVINSIVEAMKEIDVWECKGEKSGKCSFYVGAKKSIERAIQALEETIKKKMKDKEKWYERFSLKHDALLRNRHTIHKLPKKKQEEFRNDLAETTRVHDELNREIAALRSEQKKLSEKNRYYDKAFITVQEGCSGRAEFWLKKRKYTGTIPEGVPFTLLTNRKGKLELYRPLSPAKE